jgi:NNP family nitrate/nitrite transporter-like MFS transporter
MLGMGNGAVFQLVPQRFPERIGILTGIVGAAGGFGGFLLPSILGSVKQATGSFGIGFAVLALAALGGVVTLLYLKGVWRRTWPASAARRAGLRQVTAETEVYAAGV